MTTSTDLDWNAPDANRGAPRVPVGTRIARFFAGGKAALRAAGASPARGEDVARAANLAAGIAEKLGRPVPEIWTYEGPPNALFVRGTRPVLALSSQLLETYSRTEIEAVVAHLMLRSGGSDRTEVIGFADDVRTVALTRFPPALASALAKATPNEDRFAHHYLAGRGAWHRPVNERVAALQDL